MFTRLLFSALMRWIFAVPFFGSELPFPPPPPPEVVVVVAAAAAAAELLLSSSDDKAAALTKIPEQLRGFERNSRRPREEEEEVEGEQERRKQHREEEEEEAFAAETETGAGEEAQRIDDFMTHFPPQKWATPTTLTTTL